MQNVFDSKHDEIDKLFKDNDLVNDDGQLNNLGVLFALALCVGIAYYVYNRYFKKGDK